MQVSSVSLPLDVARHKIFFGVFLNYEVFNAIKEDQIRSAVYLSSTCKLLWTLGNPIVERRFEGILKNCRKPEERELLINEKFDVDITTSWSRLLNAYSLVYFLPKQNTLFREYAHHVMFNLELVILSSRYIEKGGYKIYKSLIADYLKLNCEQAVAFSDVLVVRMLTNLGWLNDFVRQGNYLRLLYDLGGEGCFLRSTGKTNYIIDKIRLHLDNHKYTYHSTQVQMVITAQEFMLLLLERKLVRFSEDNVKQVINYVISNLDDCELRASNDSDKIKIRTGAQAILLRVIKDSPGLLSEDLAILKYFTQSTIYNLCDFGDDKKELRRCARRCLSHLIKKRLFFGMELDKFIYNGLLLPYSIAQLRNSNKCIRITAGEMICVLIKNRKLIEFKDRYIRQLFSFILVYSESKNVVDSKNAAKIFEAMTEYGLVIQYIS